MSVVENVKNRTSLRTFSGVPLKDEDKKAIREYINTLKPPFEGNVRIELVSKQLDNNKPIKLGTYGVISGANDYLLLIYEDDGNQLIKESAGYMFEQVVLFCTSKELGTCWLGGTFSRGDFKKEAKMSANEVLLIVSPVGYPAEKRSFLDKMMRSGAKSDKRKPFETLFFINDFDTPLTRDNIKKYDMPLEMIRIAPSASNSQPWRVVYENNKFHFYDSASAMLSSFDMGIALCHFNETCKEMKLNGRFETLSINDVPQKSKMKYIVSWIEE